MKKRRSLQSNDALAKLAVDRIIDQPLVWFEAVVVALEQVRNQETPGAKRATAEVENGMMLSEAQSRKEAELGRAHEIVLLGRTDIGGIVRRARRQGLRRLAAQGAQIFIFAVHADVCPTPDRINSSTKRPRNRLRFPESLAGIESDFSAVGGWRSPICFLAWSSAIRRPGANCRQRS